MYERSFKSSGFNIQTTGSRSAAGAYLNGSFFHSMDSAYFLGDFTKKLYLEIWGAQFQSSQVAIQLSPLGLAGGTLSKRACGMARLGQAAKQCLNGKSREIVLMMRSFIRLLRRLLVLGIGAFSVWLIVFVVFDTADNRLP